MLVDDTVPMVTVWSFPNQEPWVDKSICTALNERTAAYKSFYRQGGGI